jgi:undecaprenyl-diphosphatase
MTAYVERLVAPVGAGLLVLAALVLAGWWSARRDPERVAAVVWSAVGAVVALGLSQVLLPVLARPRPYQVLRHVLVLVPRAASGHAYALPNGHAAVAGAVVLGLLIGRRWRLAGLALLATALLLFGGVYVGADYPSDVAAGVALGAVVALVLWPVGSWLLSPVVASISEGPFAFLVSSRAPVRGPARPLSTPGPAARLPNARAMEALRAASEAARRTSPETAPGPTTSVHTTVIKTGGRSGPAPDDGS